MNLTVQNTKLIENDFTRALNLLDISDTLQNAFIDHKTEHQSLNYF